jgi:hypothetical protein
MVNPVRRTLYDNCVIQAPDGTMFSRCRKVRLKWYLDRGLASPIDENTIRLNFQPRASISIREATTIKENICVVCGSSKKLSKHHIIPYCFRNAMPVGWRGGPALFHDVISLCTTCHIKYESAASSLKQSLADRCNITLHGYDIVFDSKRDLMGRYARSILNMPLPRKKKKKKKKGRSKFVYPPPEHIERLKERIATYLGHQPTETDLKEMVSWTSAVRGPNFMPYGKYVVDHIDLGELVLMWRDHFLDVMQPQFMPLYWDRNRLPTPAEMEEVESNPSRTEHKWRFRDATGCS